MVRTFYFNLQARGIRTFIYFATATASLSGDWSNIVGRIQKQVDDFFKGIVSTIWVIFQPRLFYREYMYIKKNTYKYLVDYPHMLLSVCA